MGYISTIRQKVGHDPIFMPAAACFIYQNGKILLQLRSDNHEWAAHGGSMEFGETPLQTLTREVREELGVDIASTNPQLINVYAGEEGHGFYPNQDEVYVVASVYLVTDYDGELNPDPEEVTELKWFSLDDLPPHSEINQPDLQPLLDTVAYIRQHLG